MSRHPIHRKRRAWCLWVPAATLGAAAYVWSLSFTLTANGLSLLGLAILAAGTVAAFNEMRQR
ncbi:hypothetical protein M3G43_02680 [Brevibacterium casei]|uniref:hypothetical protein n=1 Tax=Brevibacterium casei TaxID=33889 RepID=UPI00223AB59E|nr:hypothetical protein [Brevibacterium casei]MCT1446169.1 hypothetical protein [Brevibacterium casei]